MAKKASAKAAMAAPNAKTPAARAKRPTASARPRRAMASDKPANAADALIGLLESPLVADLLAAAVSAAAATVIDQRLRKGRTKGSLVRAVGTAAAAAVGKQLAAELKEMRTAGRAAKGTKAR